MDTWLECSISAGQFSNEHAVTVETESGPVSLFAGNADVDESTGRIRVKVVDKRNDKALVFLPKPPLEHGQHITVNIGQLSLN